MQSPDQDTGGRRRTSGGISLQTLLIASVASAVTSYLVSRIWGPGTLVGAAATPVFVALVAESLRKPVETVSATAKRVPVAQRVPVQRIRAAAARDAAPDAATRVVAPAGEPPTRVVAPAGDAATRVVPGTVSQPARVVPWPGDEATRIADPPPRAGRAAAAPGPRWRLVLATAAAAFAIVVGAFTIPDLVAGRSITGNGSKTTFFGGPKHRAPASGTTTVTTTAPATVTTTAPPAATTPAPTTGTAPPAATTPTTITTPPTTTTPATTTTAPPATTSTTPTTSGGAVPPVPGSP